MRWSDVRKLAPNLICKGVAKKLAVDHTKGRGRRPFRSGVR
jgi:hypothetical protein